MTTKLRLAVATWADDMMLTLATHLIDEDKVRAEFAAKIGGDNPERPTHILLLECQKDLPAIVRWWAEYPKHKD